MPSGNQNVQLESPLHFFDGLIADQHRFTVRCDIKEGISVDFVLHGVDLRALELQAGQQRKHRQCGVGDGNFAGESEG